MKFWRTERRWWKQMAAVACTAGGVGYLTAYVQQAGVPSILCTQHLPSEVGSSALAAAPDASVFPAALFSRVLASASGGGGDTALEVFKESVPEPAQNAPRITQIMRYGFPSLSNVRSLDDYVLSYDTRNRIPHWVFEHLTAATIAKNPDVDRNKCDFHEDTSMHQYFRSNNKDYKGSGFDRGHLAAAGNHRLSQDHCRQTFLLSNMAPQVGRGFNRDKWNDLEQYCRRQARVHRNVYVCTGPLFLPRQEEDGNLYVRYRVLGNNHVAVPTHFFKVLVCEGEAGELELEAFLLPNAVIPDHTALETFHVPVEVIERAAGVLFFDKINKSKFTKINNKKTGWF